MIKLNVKDLLKTPMPFLQRFGKSRPNPIRVGQEYAYRSFYYSILNECCRRWNEPDTSKALTENEINDMKNYLIVKRDDV